MDDITKQVRERENVSGLSGIKEMSTKYKRKKKRKSELEGVWSIYAPQFKLFNYWAFFRGPKLSSGYLAS